MPFKTISGYHDAEFKGIRKNQNSTDVTMLFAVNGDQERQLTLHGCRIFRVTDFISQNVVSRLLIFHGHEIDTDLVAEKLIWVTSLSETSSFLEERKMEEIISKIQSGAASMLVLEPSWGAEVVAIFESMSEH